MPRIRLEDRLQDHLFWAMDISANKSLPIFTPLFGFSSISAPKIQAEIESFRDGTYNYPRHVVKGGQIPPITFTRAASLYDSDFYDWIYQAIEGQTVAKSLAGRVGGVLGQASGRVRRSLLIFHFSRINLAGGINQGGAAGSILSGFQAAILGAGAGLSIGGAVGAGIAGAAAGALGFSAGPFEFATWMPARAWVLHDCLPSEYVSGSDFDATSGEVSTMSITVMPEWIEEFSFGIR